MSRKLATLGVLAALLAGAPALAASDPVFGVWLTQAKNGRVRIAPCAADPALTCGTTLWARGPNGEDGRTQPDTHNPDPALRGQMIVGLQVITGFRRDSSGGWTGGRIYDPSDGRTYKAKMVAAPDGTLKVSGCVLFFCQAQTWTRIE